MSLPALLKWGLVGLAALAAALWLGLAVGLALLQSRLVFQPGGREVRGAPTDVGLAYERLQLAPAPGVRIEAWFVPAEPDFVPGPGRSAACAGPGGRGSVLFCHGNAGNLGHRLDTVRILHLLGMNVLLFDYQGYGRSQGTPSEAGTLADARACWDWLLRERGESPGRVVLMGRSLGGAVAAQLAAELAARGRGRENPGGRAEPTAAPRELPAGLVLESTFSSIPDMGAQRFPWLPVRLLARIRYDTRSRLPLLARAGLPILFLHSPEDDLVPYDQGRALYEAYTGPKAFCELHGGHNEGFLLSGTVYDAALNRFFADVLKRN